MSRIHLSFLAPGKDSGYKDTVTDIYYKGMNVGYIIEDKNNLRDDAKNYMAYRFAHCGTDYWARGEYIYGSQSSTIAGAKEKFRAWFERDGVGTYEKYAPKARQRYATAPETLTSYVCGKALRMVDWSAVRDGDILNPICGDMSELQLHECFRRFAGWYRNKNKVWQHETAYYGEKYLDTVVEDVCVTETLKEEGIRVVYDDFAKFNTLKPYPLIMFAHTSAVSPAFAARWIGKSLTMLRKCGGQLLAILPYSTLAADTSLSYMLETKRINASMFYVEKEFKRDRTRRTAPEWVIIHVNVKPANAYSRNEADVLSENLTTLRDYEVQKPFLPDWRKKFPQDIIEEFELKARICNSFIGAYEEVKPFIMRGSERYDQPYVKLAVDDHPWRDSGVELRMACLEGVRASYWDTFIHKAANIGLMPANMEEDYKRRLAELKDYDLNDYTVRTVMEDIRRELRESCATSLLNLFDRLGSMGSRQRYDVYDYDADTLSSENTQKYCSFDKKQTAGFRLAFPNLSMYYYVFDCYRNAFNQGKAAYVVHDMESTLHLLNGGKNIPNAIDPMTAVNDNVTNGKSVGKSIAFTFFTGSFYKKGILKLKFKDSAKLLIDRLNIFVGMKRGWLPADYGTKPYDALSNAEKKVIDSFQSREEYDAVVANPDEYIIKDFDIEKLFEAR